MAANTARWCAVLLAATLALAGCAGGSRSSSLALPGSETDAAFGVTVTELDGYSPYSAGGFGVCATGNVPIVITDITPHRQQNLALSAYATHDSLDLGTTRGSLEDLGVDVTRRTVDAPCPDHITPLALEFRRTALDVTATVDGFDISYTDSAGRTGMLYLPFHVKICAPSDTSRDCQ